MPDKNQTHNKSLVSIDKDKTFPEVEYLTSHERELLGGHASRDQKEIWAGQCSAETLVLGLPLLTVIVN